MRTRFIHFLFIIIIFYLLKFIRNCKRKIYFQQYVVWLGLHFHYYCFYALFKKKKKLIANTAWALPIAKC